MERNIFGCANFGTLPDIALCSQIMAQKVPSGWVGARPLDGLFPHLQMAIFSSEPRRGAFPMPSGHCASQFILLFTQRLTALNYPADKKRFLHFAGL